MSDHKNTKSHTDMVCAALSAHIRVLEKKRQRALMNSWQYTKNTPAYSEHSNRAWLYGEQIKACVAEIESKGRTHDRYETIIASNSIPNAWRASSGARDGFKSPILQF